MSKGTVSDVVAQIQNAYAEIVIAILIYRMILLQKYQLTFLQVTSLSYPEIFDFL